MTYVDFTERPQRIISICTGISGIERGLKRAGLKLRISCYVERESFICENLACAMEAGVVGSAPIWPDLRTFDGRPFRGLVDGIIGGYPCQGESLAGKRELENYEGYLWPAVRTTIKAVGPLWCYFENVDDHLTGTFKYVLEDLRSMGYRVEAGVYSAEESGAPHERQRIFILAIHDSLFDGPESIDKISARRNASVNASKGNKLANAINGRGNARRGKASGSAKEDEGAEQREGRNKALGKRDRSNARDRSGDEQGELADATGKRTAGVNGNVFDSHEEFRQPKELQQNKGWHFARTGGELGNTNKQRSQGRSSECCAECTYESFVGSYGSPTAQQWPSKPGERQHYWEEPRIISRQAESEMGIAVDGYNFREDILRAAGNSVVEQQAEYAWHELLKKHFA